MPNGIDTEYTIERWSVSRTYTAYALSNDTRSIFTDGVGKEIRQYKVTFGKTVFSVEVEEMEKASENAYRKIKRLIENDCDRVILDERRKLANNNTIV